MVDDSCWQLISSSDNSHSQTNENDVQFSNDHTYRPTRRRSSSWDDYPGIRDESLGIPAAAKGEEKDRPRRCRVRRSVPPESFAFSINRLFRSTLI